MTAAEVKEIDSYFSAGDVNFFDAIVDSNGGDVFLYESALAVAFDDAGLADSGVSNWDELSDMWVTLSRIWLPSIKVLM